MKRFTDTAIWGKQWFQDLTPRLKCFWRFLCESVDAAGVWEPNYKLASFQIGEPVTEDDLVPFGDRIGRTESGKVVLVSFIEFQYGRLSEDCKAHIPIFRLLEKHRLSIPYQKATSSHKEKDKETETEKDTEKVEGVQGEGKNGTPPKPANGKVPQNAYALRLGKLFGRRETTRWNEKEEKAFKAIGAIDEGEFDLLEAFYSLSQNGFLRRDLLTLLNNYRGEIDRARKWDTEGRKANGSEFKGTRFEQSAPLHKKKSEYGI